jgi:hypothetical protein
MVFGNIDFCLGDIQTDFAQLYQTHFMSNFKICTKSGFSCSRYRLQKKDSIVFRVGVGGDTTEGNRFTGAFLDLTAGENPCDIKVKQQS